MWCDIACLSLAMASWIFVTNVICVFGLETRSLAVEHSRIRGRQVMTALKEELIFLILQYLNEKKYKEAVHK